ncbi:MAG TPA: pyridoxal-phosphate dependent enzyme [Bryobacteraceae bacterium]|nr:pyridoxal-phosphate dependent enzyme [Bryobacteraceae bacterium]
MKATIPGPTYQEMLYPNLRAVTDEFDPNNLFNITWRGPDNRIRHVLLSKELTGVEANIIVLTGRHFPSGSHKVGPAYTTLMEGELAGEIEPGVHTIIGPSTGNFGIGVAYISRLMGYSSIVVMPEGMSRERYERIRRYGAELDLTPGSESDVILTLERTEHYKKDPRYKILAQFELLPNYRFHRYVTGRSALEAARDYGNGRVAAFVSAPGSAGTLAAGDEIKAEFSDSIVCALEPKECSTLFNNGRGTHRIEGIGDKMVTLIHNVLTTDYVAMIHDIDCIAGLAWVEANCAPLKGLFGISGICNILGSIRMARHLGLGPDDNIVTIATDGFDRYPSVLADFDASAASFERDGAAEDILDVRPCEQKERLFAYKEEVWTKFGYSHEYLESLKSQSFWDNEYAKIEGVDSNAAFRR